MRIFCIEQLRRLPWELDLPMSQVMDAMIAYDVVSELRNAEMDRQRSRY